ncbi:MAG: acetoacetate decarboxylase [Leptospiraceae bacterium]|nr:acetoacetate decarboxylase [Leptospiraceae bacterium]
MTLDPKHYPAPWNLNGEGFVLSFWANKEKNLEHGFIDINDRDSYVGGMGSAMLVNYSSSAVGPYYELLYIPGDFIFKGKKFKKITKIYVSSELSVREGILNWAIPKELAEFEWKKENDTTSVRVKFNGKEFAYFELEKYLFPFPISTSILPYTLNQKSINTYLQTKFTGKGNAKLTKLNKVEIDNKLFPNILEVSSFSFPSIGVDPFNLTFPVPKEVAIDRN